jgi:hypothetical protein
MDDQSYHRRYLQEDGVVTCPHCEEDFEDWDVIDAPLFCPTLDADGYCRDVDQHEHKDCPCCGKFIVFGCDATEGFMPFVVRGRSEADVRLLELREERAGEL